MLTVYGNRMSNVFDDLFDDVFSDIKSLWNIKKVETTAKKGDGVASQTSTSQVNHFPRAYTTVAGAHGLELRVNVPGVRPADLDVDVQNQTLSVSFPGGTHKFTIRPEYDITAVKATLELGVLALWLPKREVPKGSKVKIEVK
jgi:HSP20 family molecular chaperone IbpA